MTSLPGLVRANVMLIQTTKWLAWGRPRHIATISGHTHAKLAVACGPRCTLPFPLRVCTRADAADCLWVDRRSLVLLLRMKFPARNAGVRRSPGLPCSSYVLSLRADFLVPFQPRGGTRSKTTTACGVIPAAPELPELQRRCICFSRVYHGIR